MPKRTSHFVIAIRFFLLCAPVGIIAALLLHRYAFYLLFGFFGTLVLFWLFATVFTNTVVRIADPQGYKALRKAGGNPFYDSLGAPLNFDTEEVRMQDENYSPPHQSYHQPSPQPQPPYSPPKQRKLWNGDNIGRT